ncbi:MAG: tRNA (N6-threonylcarbamoyladenosine(37)-N6)-methyltransferase TrmO [Prevotella sp.]|nr:tRNA (N6-threonylcarbamoyladenosine(37)-N6)-methyltransferase TrmO [Prevotella sp.]
MSEKNEILMRPVAYFRSPFASKFGVPKQSGLVESLHGEVVLETEYRNADALRGLEGFDYLWLIWGFSANKHAAASLVVRPPVLGGNEKRGVFATRSPFRPNPLGLSSVRIERIEWDTTRGPVIYVLGADLMDGTPIYDIKPYIEYADSHPGVHNGFVDTHPIKRLQVEFSEQVQRLFSADEMETLRQVLELDPRPHYQNDEQKVYGMPYKQYDIRFRVSVDGVLEVREAVVMKRQKR